MGTWPEFHRCCGVIPLRVGAIIIGTYNLVMNATFTYFYVVALIHFMRIKTKAESTSEDTSTEVEEDEIFKTVDFFLIIWFIFFSVCEAIIGFLILIGINKAHILRKAVLYMTIMWLLNLLSSLVNASKEAYFQAYLNAIRMLSSAYFILIIRSTHLELEGRLDEPDSDLPSSRSRSLSQNTLTFHNLAFQPPPPNYDEAIRLDRQNRTGLTLTLVTENEIGGFPSPNETQPMTTLPENGSNFANSNERVTAVLPVNEQTTVNSRRFSTQLSCEDNKGFKHDIEEINEMDQAANRQDTDLTSRNVQGT